MKTNSTVDCFSRLTTVTIGMNESFRLGSVHGAPTGNATPFDSFGFGIIGRKIEEYSYLCPGFFPWVNPGPATHESGKLDNKMYSRLKLKLFRV